MQYCSSYARSTCRETGVVPTFPRSKATAATGQSSPAALGIRRSSERGSFPVSVKASRAERCPVIAVEVVAPEDLGLEVLELEDMVVEVVALEVAVVEAAVLEPGAMECAS